MGSLITRSDIAEYFDKPEVLRSLDANYKALKLDERIACPTPNADSP